MVGRQTMGLEGAKGLTTLEPSLGERREVIGLCCKNSLIIQDVAVNIFSLLLWNVAKIFFATEPFMIAFPAPSMSLPKRSALIGAADLAAGQTPNRTAKDERMIIESLTLRIGCIPLFNGGNYASTCLFYKKSRAVINANGAEMS